MLFSYLPIMYELCAFTIVIAPKVFSLAFNILKTILTGNTLSKFQIYKADPNKWKPALAKAIDSDQYPAFLGGGLKDPDGNPRYTTKVSRRYYCVNVRNQTTTK